MIKKSSKNAKDSVFSADEFANNDKKRLEIKQIRLFAKQLRDLPDGARMPDWAELSVGDRLAIVAQLIPDHQRDEVMGKKSAFALGRWRSGTQIPVNVVAAVAAETEIPMEWIVTGHAMDRRPPLVYVSPESAKADMDDVPVQKLAFKAAAGRGTPILDDLAEHIRFPRAILAQVGVPPQNARLMEASGESMRTTINDGDLMLVDISESAAQIVEGKIYVFSIGNEAFVKRLRRTGERVLMVSDNREMFPEEEVPTHLPMRVYGRVKWAGRSL